MADAKKCDRCGKFYIPDFTPEFFIRFEAAPINHSFDLCSECDASLGRWYVREDKTTGELK